MQCKQAVGRGGVMVSAVGIAPVVHDEIQVHEPALHAFPVPTTGLDPFEEAFRKRHRRKAGRAGNTFLRRRIHGIDAPLIHQHRRTTQRSNGIDNTDGVMLVRDGRQGLRIRLATGRRFGVDESQHGGIGMLAKGIFNPVRIDRLPPFCFHHYGGSAGPFDVFDHAATEHAVSADDDFVAGGNRIDEAGFHPHRSGTRHREGQCVIRLIGVTQESFQLFHHFDKNRIEIADGGQRHRGQYARIDVRGSRAHQGALRRMKRGNFLARGNLLERMIQAHGTILSGDGALGHRGKHISSQPRRA